MPARWCISVHAAAPLWQIQMLLSRYKAQSQRATWGDYFR